MFKRNWWDLRAEASGGEQGGGGGSGDVVIEPAKAREFVTSWAPNPEILKDMPDDQVVAWHGNISKQLTAAQQKALESHDWRKAIAGDNTEAMKTLERFPSPKALYESYDQFRTKLSKGEMKTVQAFPEKGTDDEKAAWRQQNGVPADGKYEFKLADGIVMGEADKPVIEALTKRAYEKNVPASALNEVVGWYMEERVAREQRANEAFEKNKTETAAALGAEWGADYKGHLNKIQGVLDSTIPEGEDGAALKALVNNAIATNPMFARHYAQIALQINPAGTMVPGDRGAQEGSVSDEIKKIEGDMKKDRAAYNKDEKTQERYRSLLGAYERMTGKAWGQ